MFLSYFNMVRNLEGYKGRCWRPFLILSAVKTPTYHLSKYLVKILEPFTTNKYSIKDTFSFADEIYNQDTNLFMSSLDVESLFTNIPLEETIEICTKLVFSNDSNSHGLSKQEFRSLLTCATKDSFILFDGCYYMQIDGVAMGSPLGPTLANIFLGYHEQKWLEECPSEFKPSYYRRYVDDIFLLFKNSSHIEPFRAYMNSRHSKMRFTSEAEFNNALPFLDVHVLRDNNAFITSIYRKPTFSGVYTNYNSFLPEIYKTSLVSTLLFRSYSICSNWSLIHCEIIRLKSIMSKNAYPADIIDNVIMKFCNRLKSKSSVTNSSTAKKQLQILLPFLGSVSYKVEKNIRKYLSKHLPNYKIKVISRASTRLSSLFNFKDKIPSYLTSGVVYKFTCGRCNSTYIGKTKRHTKKRFAEHRGLSALTGKALKGQASTAVSEHSKACRYKVRLDDFEILCKEPVSNYHLLIKESLYIHRDRPQLNGQQGSIPLVLLKN